jgi:diguanylate cyclase (GGDEF)-like protein/PAS domain S-box-containing protein
VFETNLGIIELILPALCTGINFLGIIFLIYIYRRFPIKLYLAMLFMALCAFIFAGSELLILTTGGLMMNAGLAVQFHRTEQLAGVFFLFALPYLLDNLLVLNPSLHKITRVMTYSGLAAAVIITAAAFIMPDLFISMTEKNADWLAVAAEHGRGREGILYTVRDKLLGVFMVYALAVLIYDLIVHKRFAFISLPLAGILLGIAGALDDILYVHTRSYSGLFTDVPFSRFSAGISLFVTLSIASLIKQFTDQAKDVEKAYRSLDGAYKSLHNSEARFRQIAENISECIVVWDYMNRLVSYISPAYERISGYTCDSFYKEPASWINIIHEDDRENVLRTISPKVIREREDLQYRITRIDGSQRWIRNQMVSVRDKNGRIYRLISILEDITERKHNEEELIYLAYHDILTGLPNRRAFFERFHEMILQARREFPEKNKALFFIDVDRFKNINDTMGHQTGDMLLREIPKRIKKCLRGSDYIFHLGGDEFTVILYGISEDIDAAVVARKILTEFSAPFLVRGAELFLGLSLGISIYPKDGNNADVLMKNADIAMHNAKLTGNTYSFFDEEMNSQAVEKLNIENGIRGALEKKQFTLHYQPIVDITGRIAGMEALIRWNHPELGSIAPDRFIPIAESTGHIIDIGRWTLSEACSRIKSWRDSGHTGIRVAVNLSAQHLMQDSLIDDIENVLRKYDIPASSLELEITESSVMRNPDLAVTRISRLSELGISFSIDDFGTGYSSLSYLKKFKITNLKVDRSFVKDINIDQNNTEIIRAIIAMAHNLRLKVVAEGIETDEQMHFLRTLNCDFMQGYLFSRPLAPDLITELLIKGIIPG